MLSWEILKAHEEGLDVRYINLKENSDITLTKNDVFGGLDLARLYLQPHLWSIVKPKKRYWLWKIFGNGTWFKTAQFLDTNGKDTFGNSFILYNTLSDSQDKHTPISWDNLQKIKCEADYLDIE